jgi:F-type H+-transporting ATPase subunit epsilon
MHLKVLLPFQVFADEEGVKRLVAESPEGSFGLLPNRLDCVSALAPGIVTYQKEGGGEIYVAVDEGVLVKSGADVLVSVRNAIGGTNLGELRDAVNEKFRTIDEMEDTVRLAMAKLESGLLRRLTTLNHE